MLLARDTNGRRIYSSKADLAAALNINELHTAEQFEGLARTDKTGKKHNLLGIFVNLSDYTVGSTKGGEITRFNQFDIDFNQEKYLIETRLSGAADQTVVCYCTGRAREGLFPARPRIPVTTAPKGENSKWQNFTDR